MGGWIDRWIDRRRDPHRYEGASKKNEGKIEKKEEKREESNDTGISIEYMSENQETNAIISFANSNPAYFQIVSSSQRYASPTIHWSINLLI